MIILIAAAVLGIFILFKVAQKILKAVLIIAVIALAFYFWQGGSIDDLGTRGANALFKGKSLTEMVEHNCPPEEANSLKCQCVITPVMEDLEAQYSPSELSSMEADKQKREAVIKESLAKNQQEIRDCIVNKKGPEYWEGLKGAWSKLKDMAE